MNEKAYRIYLKGSVLTFSIILSLLFMVALFLETILAEHDRASIPLILPTVLLFAIAYFVHKGTLSWIRISANGRELVKVPSWFARKLLDEKRAVTSVPEGAELLFLRRRSSDGVEGYFILVRARDGSEQTVWNDVTGVFVRDWRRTARQIADSGILPARVVDQVQSKGGTSEAEWTADTDRAKWRRLRFALPAGLAPWMGIPVRLLTSSPTLIISAGLGLLCLECVGFWYASKPETTSRAQLAGLVFVGAVTYVAAILVTGALRAS